MYNRKLNPPLFQIIELSLDNLVLDKDGFYTYRVIGLDLGKQMVMIERVHGVEVIEKIVPFADLTPLPLWNQNNMLDPIVCDWLFFNRKDEWEAEYCFYGPGKKPLTVTLINKFPLNSYALFNAPDYPTGALSVPVWYAHEVQNLMTQVSRGYPNSK